MYPSELLQLLARLAESSQDIAIQVHLVDSTLVGVGGVEHLVRPGRDADSPGSADVRKVLEEIAVTVENLDAVVLTVPDIDVALGVGGNGVNRVELAWLSPALAPFGHPVAIFVVLNHPRITVAVGDI